MPGLLNDQNANIDRYGFLSLGNSGRSAGYTLAADGSTETDVGRDSTDKYALGDVTLPVPGWQLISDQATILVTYLTGDIPTRVLDASKTHKVAIPFPQELNRSFAASAGITTNSHGMKVKSLALFYRVNTTTITSFATMAINYMTMAAAAALPTVSVLTTTLAGNTLTAAANVYAAVSTVTTPIWTPTIANDNMVWGVATIVIPGSSTVDLIGASWRVSYALY